jgi:hypothetical protein
MKHKCSKARPNIVVGVVQSWLSAALRRIRIAALPVFHACCVIVISFGTSAQSVDNSLQVQQIQDAMEMARLSLAVYDLSKTDPGGGWRLIDSRNDPDGFSAGLYQRTLSDGTIQRTIAFAGTKDIRDVATDISQGLAIPMGVWDNIFTKNKFNEALDFAKQYTEIKDKNPNMTLSFTGQSLGGAYSQVASLTFGEKATVFNSAAVVKANLGLSASMQNNAPSLITQFVLQGDFVHDPTRSLPGAQQYGTEYRVSLPADLRVNLLPSLFLDHGMEAFQVALQSAYASGRGISAPTVSSPQFNQLSAFQRADIAQVYELPRQGAEVISQQLLTMADGLQSMKLLSLNSDKLQSLMKDPAFQKAFGGAPDWLNNAGDWATRLYALHNAWDSDMQEMHGLQGLADNPWVILHSKTIDQLAQIGLEKSLLPQFYHILDDHQLIPFQTQVFLDGSRAELGAPKFGGVDLVRAISSHAGRGYADIDTVTKYMDAAVGLTWGAAGLAVSGGNLRVAQISQDFGQSTANLARWSLQASGAEAAESQQMASAAGQPGQILNMYKVLQERNAIDGRPIQSILEFLSPKNATDFSQASDLMKANGFTASDYQKADQICANLTSKVGQFQNNPFKTITVSSANSSFSQMGQNAQIAADLTQGNQKVVVFGAGALADATYQRLSQTLGRNNVELLPNITDSFERNCAISDFGAQTSIRITQDNYREITQGGIRQLVPQVPQIPVTPVKPPDPSQGFPKVKPSVFPPPPGPPAKLPSVVADAGASRPPTMPMVRDQFTQAISTSIGSGLGYQASFQPPHVGGVMLQGAAAMSDSNSPLTAGNFSLIFQGSDGAIDIPTLRRFVTALWATYFADEGPGISIDPVGGFTNRHAVRYIGRVINSDLGRVMRETDYKMKEWAVGAGRPDIPNWLTPEEIGIRDGVVHTGAASRFWFVPEHMCFRQAENALLFDSGKMTVKTEYMFEHKGETNQEREEWAADFTKRYDEIAMHYPIFGELFEYAKLVSLTKYLKQHRVPLLWFLLANREMVITEDSPGTVKAFARKSDYLEECQIAGGVDLSPGIEPGNFVADAELLKAITEARQQAQMGGREKASTQDNIEIVNTTNANLTVTPSQTVVISESRSSSDDFATDIGLRLNGNPSLELARYRRTDFPQVLTFGRDWHLMIPYSIHPASDKRVVCGAFRVPEAMVLQNNLTGHETPLQFKDQFNIGTNIVPIAGYFPDQPQSSLNIGLFPLSDMTFRLDDKLGCEFEFDANGRIRRMLLADHLEYATNAAGRITGVTKVKDCEVTYEYKQERLNWRYYSTNSSPLPFRLAPEGGEQVAAQNARVPKQLRLFDSAVGSEELFSFDEKHISGFVGYFPADTNRSGYTFLAFQTDGSLILKHKSGSQIAFDPGGQFRYMVVDVMSRMIQGPYEVRFEYGIAQEQYRIVTARIIDQKSNRILYAVSYEYSRDGDLAGASIASAQ